MADDYRPKGDRFSRGLSQTPRVISTVTRTLTTGHRFRRRARTSEARRLIIGSVLKLLASEDKASLDERHLTFAHVGGELRLSPEPPGIPIRFASTPQRLGQRWWFLCPYCTRRVGTLYFIGVQESDLLGCQKCLGLSYPSQHQHRCPERDEAIVKGEVKVGTTAYFKARMREYGRLERLLEKCIKRMEGH